MKILVINSIFEPYQRGGAEVMVKSLVEGLVGEHEVLVLTASPWHGLRSLWPRQDSKGSVRIWRYYPINIFSYLDISQYALAIRAMWHLLDIFNLHSYFAVRRLLAREKPDVVMTHNVKGLGYTVPLAIRQSGVLHIHTLHDVQLVEPSGLLNFGQEKSLESLSHKMYRMVTRNLFGSPEVVISPSRFLLDFYGKYHFFPASKKVLLRNPMPDMTAQLAEQSGDPEPVNFFYLGQLEELKGIQWLISVFMTQENANWRLTVAGGGTLREWVIEQAAKDARIKYLGRVTHEELGKHFSRADCTVVPSLCYENSPMVVGESLAHDIPVIVSDIGGAAELITDEVNGIVVKPRDDEALYGAMIAIASRKMMGLSFKNVKESVHLPSVKEYVAALMKTI